MTEESSISPKMIADHIRKVTMELLETNDIYGLNAHGWLDEDTPDPEFVGHAMWQTDSLSFRYLDAVLAPTYSRSQVSAPPHLEPWQQFLITCGGDFDGLMEAARLSIGLALFQREAMDHELYDSDSFFQVHLIASMVTLGSASDRLRDVLIAAVFHQTTDEYEDDKSRRNHKPKWYRTPFAEADERLRNRRKLLGRSVAALPALAAEIYEFICKRNSIVHEIATELGRQEQQLATSLPSPGFGNCSPL